MYISLPIKISRTIVCKVNLTVHLPRERATTFPKSLRNYRRPKQCVYDFPRISEQTLEQVDTKNGTYYQPATQKTKSNMVAVSWASMRNQYKANRYNYQR